LPLDGAASESTRINGEEEGVMSSAKRTTDHDEIRTWAESRGGVPAIVKGTGEGVLRIDFVGPGSDGPDANLEQVGWDEWFRVFDDRGLELLYVPEGESRFFKLVYPGDDHER
jgi:hypothetical protein